MRLDAPSIADFYATPRGAATARLIRARLREFWPEARGCEMLGLGYPGPYLRLWRDQAARCIAAVPAQIGAAPWPVSRPGLSVLVEEDALPFADVSVDRLLLIHGLEHAETARRLLREAWWVLRPEGRMIVVVPNRASPWAYLERTPFGHGQPYSPSQLGRMLADSLFRVERRDAALFLPPLGGRAILRAAPLVERAGRRIAAQAGGIILTEATKDVAGVIPLRAGRRRRLVLAER